MSFQLPPRLSGPGGATPTGLRAILAVAGLSFLLVAVAFLVQSLFAPGLSLSNDVAGTRPVQAAAADRPLEPPGEPEVIPEEPAPIPAASREPQPVESQQVVVVVPPDGAGSAPSQGARAEEAPPESPVPAAAPTEEPAWRISTPLYPVAVMVENQEDSRPQSGLARADIVYEAMVEGGISRFMAVYVNGKSDVIGPVRSARHYFVYLAAEYNASYIHIGASPQGYAALSATKLVNLDETYGHPGFWRSQARYAPHNAYTSSDLLQSSLDKFRKVTPGSLAGFKFRESTKPFEGPEAPEIGIVYPGGYRVRYVYSPDEKCYLRYMEGLAHRDANSAEQVSPRDLVVQVVDAWGIDDVGRLDMEQVGDGKALYFRDGVVTEGRWQKASYGDITEWYDSDWNPVLFNTGKIWVQMIPPATKLSY